MKTVLCYGDSNTWGYIPGSGARYPYHIRWPGILQNQVGAQYRIMEEGLSGRYTVWDDPFRSGRNGSKLLLPLLETHAPVDLAILMLGTNDVLHFRENTAYDAARGAAVLIEIVQGSDCGPKNTSPQILLISPPFIRKLSKDLKLRCHGDGNLSLGFAKYFQQFSEQYACHFIDAAEVCAPSEVDGVHLNEVGHASLAQAIAGKITKINL